MSQTSRPLGALIPAQSGPRVSRLFRAFAQAVAIRRARKQLLRLDPHLLRDIGLSPEDAHAEASRPLWDVPDHWRR